MKKSFEGLSKAIEDLFPGELLSGAFFIFLNRRKDHMKVFFGTMMGLSFGSNAWRKELFPGNGEVKPIWIEKLYAVSDNKNSVVKVEFPAPNLKPQT